MDQRTRLLARLREEELVLDECDELVAGIMAACRDGLLVVGDDGFVHIANDAASERLGVPLDKLERGDFGLPLAPGGGTTEINVGDGHGNVRTLELSVGDLPAPNGGAPRSRTVRLAVLRDVTARKTLEQRHDDLELVARAIGHDLREPLRMVRSYLQLIERRGAGRLDEQLAEFVGLASDGADRLGAMLDGLLAFARAGQQAREPKRVPLEDALEQVRASLSRLIEERGVRLASDGSLPTVRCDPEQLQLVLQNLVKNAIAYTPPHRTPQVLVRAGIMPYGWTLAVQDNGAGIAGGDCERIFQVFERGPRPDGLTGDGDPGSGMGLAIVKRIVERNGGRVWVESTVGTGSTFYVTLPGATPDGARSSRPPAIGSVEAESVSLGPSLGGDEADAGGHA